MYIKQWILKISSKDGRLKIEVLIKIKSVLIILSVLFKILFNSELCVDEMLLNHSIQFGIWIKIKGKI